MSVRVEDIAAALRQQIEAFEATVEAMDVGTVVEVGDGIARIEGLRGAVASELVEFPVEGGQSVYGIAFNLEEDSLGVIILGDFTAIEQGDLARSTGRVISVPVGDALVGRVVNALGQPIDGKGPIRADRLRPHRAHRAAGRRAPERERAGDDGHQGHRLDDSPSGAGSVS